MRTALSRWSTASKDMIISGGENVYPKEIENALYEHAAVAECAVFGVPDDKFGEVPGRLCVMLKSRRASTEATLIELLRAALWRGSSGRARSSLSTIFPKTPIGKIQKNILRRAVLARQGEEDMSDRYSGYRRLKLDWPQDRVLRIVMDSEGRLNSGRCLRCIRNSHRSGATSIPIRMSASRS